MTKKVFKYLIQITTHETTIEMPIGAKIISVGCQNDELFLWAHVDTEKATEKRKIAVYGTGHEVTHEGVFIGTVLMFDGSLVLHVMDCGMVT